MSDSERQELMQALIAEIQIYKEPLPSGQWIKSIRFRLPIIDGDTALTLDKCDGVQTMVSLSKGEISSKPVRVEFSPEGLDTSCLLNDATYQQIKDYVLEHTGLHVSTCASRR